jgi:hypothetical protein
METARNTVYEIDPSWQPVVEEGPDRGGFDSLNSLGASRCRHDAVRAFEVEEDALEPCLVVGAAGFII